mgnify:FL=1
MGQLTQTTTQLQTILDDADASNAGNTSISDASDTTATSLKKSGFYSLQASSSNAPSTDRSALLTAVRNTGATGEIRYGQIVWTESNGLWWNRDDGGSLGTWYEAVGTAATQTLTNKTLTSAVLTTPQINDSSADHQYIFAAANLAADRTVSLPLLGGNDTFVFEAHTQTLTNKTLTSPVITGGSINNTPIGASTASTVVATQVNIEGQGDLRLQDSAGSEYVALQAPATLSGSYTLTLPGDDGTANQVLQTDGSGVTSWTNISSAGIADGSITTAKLADDAVTQAKVADDAIGADQLAASAVVTASVVDDAITSAKLAHALDVVTSLGIGGGSTNGVSITQGAISIKNGGAQSYIDLYCESSNAHYARILAPAHSAFSGNITLTLPAATDTLVGKATTDTLTNKTLTSPKINEDVAVTSTATEINILDGVTSTTAELNILDGVTSTTAEINILDGVTATTAEINYLDVTTLGTSEANKAVTSDANGVTKFDNGIQEESTAVTSSSNAATLNLRDGSVFTHTLSENVTYTFSNPAASGYASSFTLKVTQDSSARTITWPGSVDWAAATAPTLSTGSGDVDVFVFLTVDGGTTYYGFTAGQDLS